MAKGCDMIVGLYHLPEMPVIEGVKIKRAFVGDKNKILSFVNEHFSEGWVCEAEHALLDTPSKCFIATEEGRIVGFACFDSSARGFIGPIGIDVSCRGRDIGKALLIRTLNAMREYGYAYAVIGWVDSAEHFYRKAVGAEFIKNGSPENSVYSNMISI